MLSGLVPFLFDQILRQRFLVAFASIIAKNLTNLGWS